MHHVYAAIWIHFESMYIGEGITYGVILHTKEQKLSQLYNFFIHKV